ncbi:hypothetical protein [Rhizobium leguminosarum]|uniref:hypothetical protein n=1 Tax=Rhizobium leguminosarum TaxID=384 RepID=UPI001C97F103|nr:hypothetical protein [Rhizobium leguminosarum]MBY5750929.1 hypothetical protein [Rhizobium leguminosarum]
MRGKRYAMFSRLTAELNFAIALSKLSLEEKTMIIGVKVRRRPSACRLDAGTVTATAGKREDYVISATGPAPTDNDVLDFAEYFETKAEAFSGHFWTTPEVDLAVGFEPKVAAFSGRPCLPNSGGRRSRYQGELSKISGGIWSA